MIETLFLMDDSKVSFIEHVVDVLRIYSNFPLDVCYFIGCQFALESSYGLSSLAVDNFNFCGMKNPLVRISSAKHAGDCNYHWAQFYDLSHCVVDYLLCLQYHRPLSCDYDTVDHFSRFISKFYCPQRDYISNIQSIYKQFKSYKNGKRC